MIYSPPISPYWNDPHDLDTMIERSEVAVIAGREFILMREVQNNSRAGCTAKELCYTGYVIRVSCGGGSIRAVGGFIYWGDLSTYEHQGIASGKADIRFLLFQFFELFKCK